MRLRTPSILLWLVVLAGGLTVSAPGQELPDDFLIVPDKRFGPVTADTSEADLKNRLGADQVKDGFVYFAEGACVPGTEVYPGDPEKRFLISWLDPEKRLFPIRVVAKGKNSVWKTPQGVRVGSNVRELVEANGKDFLFMGFSWDYGGFIGNWQKGRLEEAMTSITLRLSCCDEYFRATHAETIPIETFGNHQFSSSELAEVAQYITVEELTLMFFENIRKNKDPEGETRYLVPCPAPPSPEPSP